MERSTSSAPRTPGASVRWLFAGIPIAALALALGSNYYWQNREGGQAADSAADATQYERVIATVGFDDVEYAIPAPGVLRFRAIAPVDARASGKLAALHVALGDRVAEGQLLAELDAREQRNRVLLVTSELEVLKSQLRVEENEFANARAELERLARASSPLVDRLDAAELAQLNASADVLAVREQLAQKELELGLEKIALDNMELKAPIAGVVTSIDVIEGAYVDARDAPTVMQIGDDSRLVVEAEIDENRLDDLGSVEAAYFYTSASDRRWDGVVQQIVPVGRRTENGVRYTVIVETWAAAAELAPGMTAQVFLVVESAENVLTVPRAALTPDRSSTDVRRATAEVVRDDGTTEKREVIVGAADETKAEVLSGLVEGERVVAGRVPVS